ncbi:hypothetical protein [Sulfurivirga sp.]|uniref:hypothetical protein n=1 Tax=Sulfurivirga sp. TaxID=2614236 RepID=UPI0025E1EA7A|nr:hypothetical protein [Sulfurivirga sp.]
MKRPPSERKLRNRLRPYFNRVGVSRMPELIFDGRKHHFSQWGLSYQGRWWYRLSPEHNRGAIGDERGLIVAFRLWPEPSPFDGELTHAGHSLREV